jgi:hypothetical protein
MAKALVNPRSVYTWDAKALRYRAPSGAFVSKQAIKQALNTFVLRSQKEIERLAGQVASGKMTVQDWQEQTANLIKNGHLASAAAAKGGWAQMTPGDYGKLGAGLKFQYAHLRDFAKEVSVKRLTPKDIIDRAGMYARSSSGAFEQARFDTYADMVEAGARVRMRNKLGKADHCTPGNGRPGCVAETERGWVEFGEMSLPGQRKCLTRCFCTIEYDHR